MDKQRRNTRTKQMILEVLASSNSALSREEISKRLSKKMDRVTLFRILQSFCDEGKLHRVVGDDGAIYYALCSGCTAGNHHDAHPHFHCIACNEVTCIGEAVAGQALPTGYSALSFVSYISGYCRKCSALLKPLCLLVVLLAMQTAAMAQTRVKALDAESGEPVEYAAVYFPELKTGCVTDSQGEFTVDLDAPQILAQISAVGYQTYRQYIQLRQGSQRLYLQAAVHELQEIVAIENSSRLQGENVLAVEKLNIADRSLPGMSLTGKLSAVPGIENLSTGAGIGKPVVRGLSGNRVAVFSQGLRIENQQWGDEHGLGLDENGYEQVEIIKGPASLLYGSDALGGALYFVDERYASDGNLEARFGSEFAGNTAGWNNKGAIKFSKNKLHFNLFGGYNSNKDYADGNNFRVPNSRFNTGNIKTALGYTGNKFSAAIKYGFLGESYGLTELEEHDEHEDEHASGSERTPNLPFQKMNTHYVSSENTWFLADGAKLKIDLGYIANSRKEFEDEHEHEHEDEANDHHESEEPALDMHLQTFSWNIKWYSAMISERWTITVGNQGMAQRNSNRGEEVLIPDANTFDIGAFALAGFHYSEKATLQTGLRVDHRSINAKAIGEIDGLKRDYFALNFSVGLHQPISDAMTLRATIASGFRAPNMYELLSNGVHHGTNRYETGNPDLKIENSFQADLGLSYSTKHISLFANPYFNYIRNYIYLQPSGSIIDEAPAFSYVQADAYLYGGEAGFHLHPHPLDWLHLESSFSSVYGQERNGAYLALMPSQKIRTTISANFRFANKKPQQPLLRMISIYMQNLYSMAQNRVALNEDSTPAYNLLNAGIAMELALKSQPVQLNLSVSNLLNKTYYDHLSRYKTIGLYNIGRSLHLKIQLPLPPQKRSR
ncbi:MAG: TonB-dependent receptor [Tannerellaceae bacterium]|jgi:iron complex outermembrane receptor protein|nr:TonB-dependent receptor [Tannerellaceae bacterium]